MRELWKLTASPRHLAVFEAAARLGSFTRAAEEMNVQQPAVSASVKQLESALGVVLFLREHKKITLTTAGERLYSDVSGAFGQILGSVHSVRQLSRAEHVTLNASTAFNHYWMMPRLQDLHRMSPDIDLRLQSSDREPDIDAENISLGVRRGYGDWPDCHASLIAREEIYPVASPARLAPGRFTRPEDILRERLIHLEEPIRARPGWQNWADHFGITEKLPDSGLRLNDYALVLQAAIAGEGVAFGWHHVTEPLLAQGLLVARPEWTWRSGAGFYLVWSKTRPLSDKAAQVRDWILDQCGGAESSP